MTESNHQTYDFPRFFKDMSDSERLQVSRDELEWIQGRVAPDRTAEVVVALSCGAQTTPYVMLTQVAVLKALSVDFVATAGQAYCCGNVFNVKGRTDVAARTVANSIRRFSELGAKVSVQCCGSCYVQFDDTVAAMDAESPGSAPFRVAQMSEYVLEVLRRLGDRVPWQKTIPRRVLVHAEGAEAKRGKAEARDAVIETLGLIPGVEFAGMVENPTLGAPCLRVPAASGRDGYIFDGIGPADYRKIQSELAEQAREARADAIVTLHHACQREWCKFGSDRLPIMFYQTLIAEALGVHVPDRFQILWRTGDPDRILELTRPHWESWNIAEPEAREIVRRFFVPEYAAEVDKCPCEGDCFRTRIAAASTTA